MGKAEASGNPMTVGALSRRTGVRVKSLRQYEDLGLVCTMGRSEGNYRLFGEEALWCVGAVQTLRGLGLTLAEIQKIANTYLGDPHKPIGPVLGQVLQEVRVRTEGRIAQLSGILDKLDAFEAANSAQLNHQIDYHICDPRSCKPSA